MIDERVSFLEIFSSIPRMLINHNLIFKNLLNLILKENYHNEDPLLEFWSIFEILSITDVIIICRQSENLSNLNKQRVLRNIMNNQSIQVLFKYKQVYVHQKDYVIPNKTFRMYNVSDKEKYQENVVEIYLVHSTKENSNKNHNIQIFYKNKKEIVYCRSFWVS